MITRSMLNEMSVYKLEKMLENLTVLKTTKNVNEALAAIKANLLVIQRNSTYFVYDQAYDHGYFDCSNIQEENN